MRLVVTGRTGQVATALVERGAACGVDVFTVGRPEIDLSDVGDLIPLLAQFQPDAVVSAAAYTAVDRAESERDLAFAVNGAGAGAVARAAASLGIPLLHLSTDYVFDGSKEGGWVENDPVGPLGVYGASKLAGEEAVLASGGRVAVLRVAWVYSPFGTNFVRTMLRLAETRDRISVVDDQIGAPTSALDIAEGIIAVARNLVGRTQETELAGIFHMGAGGPDASWADFAEAIFEGSARRGGKRPSVERILTTAYPTPAQRPKRSRLVSTKLAQVHGVIMPDWRASLEIVLDRMSRLPIRET